MSLQARIRNLLVVAQRAVEIKAKDVALEALEAAYKFACVDDVLQAADIHRALHHVRRIKN